jgi:hypothetical protein
MMSENWHYYQKNTKKVKKFNKKWGCVLKKEEKKLKNT